MLELDEGKLSRPVLRRGGESNLASLSRPVCRSNTSVRIQAAISVMRSCTRPLRIIISPRKPGTMPPHHLVVRGRCHDSTSIVLSAGSVTKRLLCLPYSQNIRTRFLAGGYTPTTAHAWACLPLHSYPYSASMPMPSGGCDPSRRSAYRDSSCLGNALYDMC